ncbi:MAG: LytTR family DNA-binding domain-containing protein [Algoriphagus sp.]|nr:LytTR family DNA-binding domain-containing protein [Algoriphagus sp.]
MNILLIEDEKPAVNRLLMLLKVHFPEAVFHENLDSITASIKWLNSNPAPDLILCDIQLADGLSFGIFEKVEVITPIIFTTAYDQYAIKAFQVNAIDYLLKPIDSTELARAVGKFKNSQIKPTIDLRILKDLFQPQSISFKSRFLIRYGEKIQSIPVEDISFVFSEERVTFIQTHEGKKFVIDSTLDQTESQLDPRIFFRLNRKYLCKAEAILEILSYSNSRLKIKIKNFPDNDILISREKVGDFKNWLDS